MVDDSDDRAPGSQRSRPSKVKYTAILQDVANRMRSHVLIDLNDLEEVRRPAPYLDYKCAQTEHSNSTSAPTWTKTPTTG